MMSDLFVQCLKCKAIKNRWRFYCRWLNGYKFRTNLCKDCANTMRTKAADKTDLKLLK